ncbi:MAG: hypothetical protein RL684_861 [Pseudomonadota bacterium]|jgi:hypothetical protein
MKLIAPVLLAAALVSSPRPSVAADAPIYLQLDGRWYSVADGPRVWWFNGYGFYMPTATAAGCRRDDGQPQEFGGVGAYLGAFFYPVYRITSFHYRPLPQLPGKAVMSYRTAPGNIVCDNEIESPIPDPVFRDGFDLAPSMFRDGFDGR